jgi:glycine dehydrogenase subunit 2
VKERLKATFELPYDRICMHECVFSASRQAKHGAHAIDLAKFLIDQDMHPPTVYFPLTVKESIMIEPTETESKETLDVFVEAMQAFDAQAQKDSSVFHDMPKTTPVTRPDEVKAARELNTNYFQ